MWRRNARKPPTSTTNRSTATMYGTFTSPFEVHSSTQAATVVPRTPTWAPLRGWKRRAAEREKIPYQCGFSEGDLTDGALHERNRFGFGERRHHGHQVRGSGQHAEHEGAEPRSIAVWCFPAAVTPAQE